MCHASLCCLVLCKPFNDLFFFPQPVVFLIAGAKVRLFLLSGKLSGTFFSKKRGFSRILTCGGEDSLLYIRAGVAGLSRPAGGVPTTQQKFQSPEHRVSEPGTHSFKAWNTQFQSPEHTVSNAWNTQFQTPETLRALGAPTFSSKKGFPVAKEALITTIPKGLFHHLHHLVALLHDINAFLQAFKTIANLHSA